MDAKEYLYDVAAMLDSEPYRDGPIAYIRIHDGTAKDIAIKLREIADGLIPTQLH